MTKPPTKSGYVITFEQYLLEADSTKGSANDNIPSRYIEAGFHEVGRKKEAPGGADHKWEVLAAKKVKGKWRYRVVKGGQRGMEDYSQHGDDERRKRFWARMGGKDGPRAKDPFSPLYWHKKFGTW